MIWVFDMCSDDVLIVKRRQAQIAMDTADVICFFATVGTGMTAEDQEVAAYLAAKRTSRYYWWSTRWTRKRRWITCTNTTIWGSATPSAFAQHQYAWLGDLLEEIAVLPPPEPDEQDDEPCDSIGGGRPPQRGQKLAVQSVACAGTHDGQRHPRNHTRRDRYPVYRCGRTAFNIIDTAGMRKKRAVEDETLEKYSVLRSIAAIERCDVALLLLDAQEGVTEQDTKIAGLILDAGKAVIVAVTKWDAVEKDTNTRRRCGVKSSAISNS